MCQNLTKILSVYLQEPLAHFLSSCYLFIVYFWSFWVFVAVCRLSLVAVSGNYSSSLQYTDFSLWGLLLLRSMDSRLKGFSSCGALDSLPHSMWDLGSQTRDQTCVLSIERQILNHWTIQEVPYLIFFLSFFGSRGWGTWGG